MNEFFLLFRNRGGEQAYLATSEDMARDMPRWQAWIGAVAMKGNLVSTAPIAYQGSVVRKDGVTGGHPVKDLHHVLVTGYLICKAERIEDLFEWAQACPVLDYPDSSVEIRPIIPFSIG